MRRVPLTLGVMLATTIAACAEQDSTPTAVDAVSDGRTVSASVASTHGLVAYFPFEGDATDASGNGHDGIASSSGVAWVDGVNGQAASFATGAFVRVPDDPKLDTDAAMTVTAVVRPNSLSPYGSIFLSKWLASPVIGDWLLRLSPNGDGTARLLANAADYDATPDLDESDEIVFLYQSPDSPRIPMNAWTFVGMTFDAGTLTIYVNGRIVGQMITPFTTIEPDEYGTDDIYIGDFRGINSAPYRFDGSIDEVRLYDRALSPREILNLLKDHCRNGGSDALGFRNEGQCVRWVETGEDSR